MSSYRSAHVLALVALVVTTAYARPKTRTVTGLVLDVGCQPLPAATVRVGNQGSVVTDERGRFSATADGATVVVRAQLAGFRTVQRELHLSSGSPTDVRLFLPVGPLAEVASSNHAGQRVIDPARPPEQPRLRGRVLDSQCRPLAGATVRVVTAQQAGQTAADGRFEFPSITSGSHDLVVTATGFATTEVKAVFFDDKNTGYVEVPLDAAPAGDRVTVYAR